MHAISLYIYQTLICECFGGVVCLGEAIRFSQPLWTLRMDGTPPVEPLVPEVRLFFILFYFSEHLMGPAHGSVPVLTSCRIWWVLKHKLSLNNRCLVLFLLLRGRSACGCAERVVLCE